MLRFFAAFYVFVFHINIRTKVDLFPELNTSISNGAIGMSIFFTLSGFVLMYNYYGNITKNYFRKRIARIYPAYIFCGLITLPFLINSNDFPVVITSISLYVLSLQAWFYQAFSIWNFGGTWSISVEMFFYAMFPLLLNYINDKNVIPLLVLSYISTSIIIPVSLQLSDEILFPVYYSNPVYRLPEFIFGMCIAKLFISGVKIKHWQVIITTAIFIYTTTFNNIGYMQNNFIIIPAIGVALLYLSTIDIPKNKITSSLIYLGEISYSFYLMQMPIMMYLDKYKDSFFRQNGLLSWGLVLLINLGLAIICYSFIEKRSYFRKMIIR